MSERLTSVTHNGKTVLISDFSNLQGAELMQLMQRARLRDAGSPPGSLLLTDITGCHINAEIRELAVEMGQDADRKGFKQAIVGVTGIQRVIFMAFKRSLHLAKDRQDALTWLTAESSCAAS